MNNGRLVYFDWIRGCMILWMLVYHISLNYGRIKFGVPEDSASIFTFMSFFMAPFYVGAGYFFSFKKSLKDFWDNQIRKLFVPYCFFTIFGIMIFEIYSMAANGGLGAISLIAAIPTGCLRTNTPMWFLFSLFMCRMIYYCINKMAIRVGGGKIVHLVIAICFVLAFFTKNKHQIFGYGNIFLGLIFIHMGFCLKKYAERCIRVYLGISAIVFYLTISIFAPQRMEFVRNILVQGNYMLNFIFTICACFALWYIAQQWKHNNLIGRGFVAMGRDSLVVFAFHRPVLNYIIEPLLRYINPAISYHYFLFISLIVILLLYYLLNAFLKRCCPKLIGL